MLARASSCRGASASPRCAGRRQLCVRAAANPEGDGLQIQGNTVFYGGQAYTEAEFRAALESDKLVRPVAPARLTSQAAASVSTLSFNDVMGFSGTAPELVNGRLAMIGFTSAIAAELASGESVLKQWSDEPTGVALAFLVFIAGSLVTAFQAKRDEKLGPFTPQAEMINGRAAMIGFASMLIIEAVKGSPLL